MSNHPVGQVVPFYCPTCHTEKPKYIFTFASEVLGSELAPIGMIQYVTISCGGLIDRRKRAEDPPNIVECGAILGISVMGFQPGEELIAQAKRLGFTS